MKIFRFVLSFSLALLSITAFAQKDTLRILAIGNSFSCNALDGYFGEIAAADGKYFTVTGNMFIGGCSLERHWKNASGNLPEYQYRKRTGVGETVFTKGYTLEQALSDEKWDIVTFQQASHYSGLGETYEPYLADLVSYVKARTKADVRLAWHQTWAYHSCSGHPGFRNYDRDQAKMYAAIMRESLNACKKYGMEIIPAGTAIQNLRNTYDRDNCTGDGFHLNAIGRYTIALTWYESLTGRDVSGINYDAPGVAPYRCKLGRLCSGLAVGKPYAVSDVAALGYGSLNDKANYDERYVPSFSLPDPLVSNDGRIIRTRKKWESIRRPEILEMFEKEMFGKIPPRPDCLRFEVLSSDRNAFGGKATRKEVKVIYGTSEDDYFVLLVYTPNAVKKAPMFLGANFNGNYSLTMDEGVTIPKLGNKHFCYRASLERGSKIGRCPLDRILASGYGIATFCYSELEPDMADNWKGLKSKMKGDWGAISSWAWGLCRSLDYLETDADVNAAKVAVIGHSRLGKAALWAGAEDTRFAMVISNNSGCGGAALSRRAYGETIRFINTHFPHWFVPAFKKYNDNEKALPFDQHELLALIAPRPLCVGSAGDDLWADPQGERMAVEATAEVYALYGSNSFGKLRYHIREGKHDLTARDWSYYLAAADKYLK